MTEPLYYGQNKEDQWIAENLGHLLPDRGFYVDIGCAHPFTTSNTAFLRDRKWEGLAIDGNRKWARDWDNIPAFHVAVIASGGQVSFKEDDWWGRVGHGELREAETIEQILDRFEVGKIDFLSIDTEGSELDILETFDFEKHDPAIVIAEYNAMHLTLVGAPASPIPPFMATKGYKLVKVFGVVNMIFTK